MENRKSKSRRCKEKTGMKGKSSKNQQIDTIYNDPFSKCFGYIGHLNGLKKIILSPKAQEYVGCRIGLQITSLTPWIIVRTDRIKQHINLYQNRSDFYSVKTFMERYRDPDVLLGCYNHNLPDQEQEFYICTTRRAKSEVHKILRKERKSSTKNVYKTFNYGALFWQTVNENDAGKKWNDSKRRSFREVEINLPLPIGKKKLSTRAVQDAGDGYVEFPPNNDKFRNIMRRRIDNCVQPSKTENKKIGTTKSLTENIHAKYKQDLEQIDKTIMLNMKRNENVAGRK